MENNLIICLIFLFYSFIYFGEGGGIMSLEYYAQEFEEVIKYV